MYVDTMTIQERLSPGKYRLNVNDYSRLGEAGVFGDAKTELIAGEIIVMSPEWRPHMRVKDELAYRLRRALENLGSDLFVGTGGSVGIHAHEMPRPDIILTNAVHGEGAIPVGSVILLVEVSASTLDYDLRQKAAIYASASVPEYWVVDVDARVIHQMWKPTGDAYVERHTFDFGAQITAKTIEGVRLDTSAL